MNHRWWASVGSLALLALVAPGAGAAGLGVEVWTDRGNDAIYQPGDHLEVRARASEDMYLIVYEIDAEGYVRLLFPFRGNNGFVEGRRTYVIPPEQANVDLVVQEAPVGQCYVVAVASREPFREFPWYLRPYDLQAENVGYEGMRDDEEGITSEGRIVGDPFVAMERIRRRVVASADSVDAFATSYASYYVHAEVKYPRYLCYDCHRPGRWAWWPGFDPYYTHCSVFDFRVNWSWGWGPGYWFGCVPYYYYVVRPTCPPHYYPYYVGRNYFSSWDGWGRYRALWGDHLVRFKSDPPAGYVPPSRYRDPGSGRSPRQVPPGFVATNVRRGSEGLRPKLVVGRGREARPGEMQPRDEGTRTRRSAYVPRTPRDEGQRPDPSPGGEPPRSARPGRDPAPREEGPRVVRPRESSPRENTPREEGPRVARPRDNSPREEKPRDDSQGYDKPRQESPSKGSPRQDSPRYSPGSGRSGGGSVGRGGMRTKG